MSEGTKEHSPFPFVARRVFKPMYPLGAWSIEPEDIAYYPFEVDCIEIDIWRAYVARQIAEQRAALINDFKGEDREALIAAAEHVRTDPSYDNARRLMRRGKAGPEGLSG